MSQKILGEDGVTEIEVFTTDELAAKVAEATAAAEGVWKPKLGELETKLTEAQQRVADRAVQMGQFRKLSDEQKAKLDETQRLLYDNMELLDAERTKNAGADKKAYDTAVASAIRGIVGKNDVLFGKVKDMYDVIQLEDVTPEQVAVRAKAAFGALGMSSPDLLASAGFRTDGAFEPPSEKKDPNAKESFADTPEGKAAAAALGLKIDLTDDEKKIVERNRAAGLI